MLQLKASLAQKEESSKAVEAFVGPDPGPSTSEDAGKDSRQEKASVTVGAGPRCNTCGGTFEDAAAHRLHFKYYLSHTPTPYVTRILCVGRSGTPTTSSSR